ALDDDAYTDACVEDLVQVFDMMTSGDVAAMIAEPIQGVGGFAVPPDGFFGAMKKELDNRGVLFISDEVQTGWGRTGDNFWGYQAHGITPDILTFAKGVGNGLALGGVVASAEVMNSLPANSLSTFGGNPLSSAGALATIQYMLDNDLQGNSKQMGARLEGLLRPAAEACPSVGELRGRGLMLAFEMVRPGTNEPDADAAARLLEAARSRGVLIGKGGLYGNVLRIAPPMTVTPDEIDEAGETIAAALGSLMEAS
ncbi:MAG: aminotransferase class III-fold pyridoxal phosphate-dependent enzyme, partial [Acidimicrobiales bacterium]|nr:aminotransferase class III-fold pyridoxal phosphate-dependent enzyme [Acidimicrobiales bacterium]